MMNKRNSSGGGQSSLGYLFGSDDLEQQQQLQHDQSNVASSPICLPPYGTDSKEEKLPEKAPTPPKKDDPGASEKYIYHGNGDQSTGFLVSGRPSTRVKSVPGGDSSLGYLFGDK